MSCIYVIFDSVKKKALILADGSFPVHEIPLNLIRNAEFIVCCDGSVSSLVAFGMEPDAIAGDMDSISPLLLNKYSDRVFRSNDQETNDLTKAVEWCAESGFTELSIAGATGKRDDHTIGNISLLAEYGKIAKVSLYTDTGLFMPFYVDCLIETWPGQQISIFSIISSTEISSKGLKYPLKNRKLGNWWEGTLNEATGNVIELSFSGGPLIVFLNYHDSVEESRLPSRTKVIS